MGPESCIALPAEICLLMVKWQCLIPAPAIQTNLGLFGQLSLLAEYVGVCLTGRGLKVNPRFGVGPLD